MGRDPWLAVLLLVLLSRGLGAQGLAEPPPNPAPRDCVAIGRDNARQLKALSDRHEQCLHQNTPDPISYRAANPCSSLACRELHLQIAALLRDIEPVGEACSARLAQPPLLGFYRGEAAANDQAMAGKLADTRKLVEQVKKLEQQRQLADEQPWQVAQAAWGDTATFLRTVLARGAAGGRPQDDPNWLMYDLLFNKAGEPAGAAATNPIGKLVTDSMLSQLRATEAGLRQAAAATAGQVDRLFEATALPPAPVVPVETVPPQAGQPGCEVFQDVDRSRALLARDPQQWRRLNAACHP